MSGNLWHNVRFVAWVVLALAVIGFIVIWIVFRNASVTRQASSPSANPVAVVPDDQLPAVFPPNVPLEPGATVTSNFNSAAANGQVQATRSFRSAKSVDENYAIYHAFLTGKTGGWTVVSEVDDAQNGSKSIFAKGNGGFLTVAIAPLQPDPFPSTSVTITYVTNPAPAPAPAAPSPSSTTSSTAK